jgi:hypothetical protein
MPDTITMGIDLSSQPAKTAVCLLKWEREGPSVLLLRRGNVEGGTALHTKWLSTTAYGVRGDYGAPITKVGIDAPFGWPEPFADAIAAAGDFHQLAASPTIDAGIAHDLIGGSDFDGQPGIQGSAPDIGADEFVARPSNQFILGKKKLNKKKGTATLNFTLPTPAS